LVKIIPFEEKYLSDFIYDGEEAALTQGYDIKEVAKMYNILGPSFMGFINGKLMGMGGIYKVFEGIGQAWLFLNKLESHTKDSFKGIKEYMAKIIKEKDYKKVQIYCMKDNFKINNLAQHLGFHKITDLSLYELGE